MTLTGELPCSLCWDESSPRPKARTVSESGFPWVCIEVYNMNHNYSDTKTSVSICWRGL